MNSPTVSVIMPCFNSVEYLPQAIESILCQAFRDFELIIVDDASTDGSSEFALAASRVDPRVRYYRNRVNKGVIYSRNFALLKARGRFIALQDSDDVSFPKRLELQVKTFNRFPDVVICGGNTQIIDGEDNVLGFRSYPRSAEKIEKSLLLANPFAASAVMVRREVLVAVGGFGSSGESTVEDYWAWIRVLQNGNGKNLNSHLIKYREHSSVVRDSVRRKLWNTIRCKLPWIFTRKYFSFLGLLIVFVELSFMFVPQSLVYRVFSLVKYKKPLRGLMGC
ncbi:glycosyltransferase family 2 protein [Microbulbifer elongatus]|uniref:glycosyltransferase family 2 protein n=1 Tax=Microbulbifer elongatus TaxID=86173 RepID=UPI001F4B2DB7|nr:glycosyltransferase family 2 protein [Microbulbifer elongatus]